MNCNNCTNNNALKEVKIKHVHGNVLRMAIPLTLRTIELVDGEINATDTPFIPSSEHPVKVVFSKGSVSVVLDATMKDGNIAYIEEKGKIPVGTYAITVTCNDDNGNPYRFKQNAVLYVADATIEAGIEETIEYEVTTWYLDAAIFLALKGEDGVGIDDIETQSSGEIGGVNTVTFILTDGRTRSFTILNGSGAVDSDLDINSPSPIANSAVTAKFNELAGELADLFGDVDYDSSTKSIRFWDKGKTNVLASLDARPFIKDGMVSNAYISNNTLVITFNTDSGKEAIGVPLTSVFNPNNYYTKTQVDSRIASAVANINLSNYYTKAQVDTLVSGKANIDQRTGELTASQATRVVLDYIVGVYDGEDEPAHEVEAGNVWYDNGQIYHSYTGDVEVEIEPLGEPQSSIVYCNAENNKTYRWTGSEFVQVGGSGSGSGGYEPPVGGIPKSDLAQSVQDTLDDVSNKVDKVAGKGLSTEDYTTAEKQKLEGLSNYDDTEIQAEVDLKYEKPSTGIPKTDLASDVQTSLGKADTALQSHQSLADVFAIVDYDSTTKHINFYGKGDTNKATVLGYVDATNFIKDGMVSNVAISNGNLVVTFNTDSGKEPISIALTQIFNPENYYNKTAVDGLIANKVDKETGKGLSTNDYTTAEKTKLAGLENYDDSALQTAIDGKVDKESGKSLMTDAERTKLQGIAAGAEVNVQPNWTQTNTSADDYIKNKPTLATVATSGSYNDLSNKPTIPDTSGFVTTSTMNTALAGKQDTLTFDDVPTAGSNKPVKSGGIKTALDAKANTADVPTKTEMADAIDDALGEAEVTVVPANSVGIITSLGSDSNEDALSASMGKKLKIAILQIYSSLGAYAFPNGKPNLDFDEIITYSVDKTIGTGLSATGGDTDVELGDSLEVSIAITNNLYIIDDDNVVVTMGGQPVAGAWNAGTMKVTITTVTGNVVINVPSMTYVDVDGSNNQLAFMLDCKNRGGQAGHWIDLIGNKDFALTDVTEADDGMVFNGSTSKGVASGSLDVYYCNNTYGSATIEAVVDMSSFTPTSGQRFPILANTLDGRVAASFRTTGGGAQLIGCSTNITGVDDPNNNTGFFFTKDNKSFGTTGGTDGGIVVVDGNVPENPRVNLTHGQGLDVHDFGAGLSSVCAVGYGNISSTNCYFKGKILAIRVYKTKLTTQQIIYNHNIDKKRFNLA